MVSQQIKVHLQERLTTRQRELRPISLLSIPGKVLESIIADEIDTHFLHTPGIHSNHQWGFKMSRSPELLMLHLNETWKESIDRGKTVGGFIHRF